MTWPTIPSRLASIRLVNPFSRIPHHPRFLSPQDILEYFQFLGAWHALVQRKGSPLPPRTRTEFEARRRAAQRGPSASLEFLMITIEFQNAMGGFCKLGQNMIDLRKGKDVKMSSLPLSGDMNTILWPKATVRLDDNGMDDLANEAYDILELALEVLVEMDRYVWQAEQMQFAGELSPQASAALADGLDKMMAQIEENRPRAFRNERPAVREIMESIGMGLRSGQRGPMDGMIGDDICRSPALDFILVSFSNDRFRPAVHSEPRADLPSTPPNPRPSSISFVNEDERARYEPLVRDSDQYRAADRDILRPESRSERLVRLQRESERNLQGGNSDETRAEIERLVNILGRSVAPVATQDSGRD